MNKFPFKLKNNIFLTDPEEHETSAGGKNPPEVLPHRLRGVYLLPNLLTIAGLFAGFYAIVAAMKGYFDFATISIFIAMIMDFLDGRVARLTHSQSNFGAELDSLADMVSFGIAPAVVIYSWSLESLGKLGWLAAFIFVAAGSLRLARFNSQTEVADKRFFQGLPIPAAAGIISSLVWIGVDSEIPGDYVATAAAIITFIVGLLMVSNFRYHSFKQLDYKGRVPFVAILIVIALFVAVSLDPPKVLFILFFCYGIWGPGYTLWKLYSQRTNKKTL